MAALSPDGPPWPAAVAVSGGGDSVALMLLLSRWAEKHRAAPPVVLTVDHGLREDSAGAARKVAKAAKIRKLSAHVLTWKGAKPKADIENAARLARYRLMGEWCAEHKVRTLYVAHNLEDQAETFLLRLARGSGVDGLSAMRAIAPYPIPGFAGLALVRPLLGFRRDELRKFLKTGGEKWAKDPMNEDPRFARARFRALLPALEDVGLSADRIAGAAGHLARARETLDSLSGALIARYVQPHGRNVLASSAALAAAPPELALRALAELLRQVSGADYRPRFQSLESLLGAIRDGRLGAGRTLHGCKIGPAPRRLAIFGPQTLLIQPEPARKPRKG